MEPKDEIKQRLDIVDLVGEYLPLKSAGSGSFKALCPFHSEKTPSFHVSREKEIWHCFGCDKGGDVYSFVMEIEGMSFPEALRHLGKKTGVKIPEFRPGKAKESNEKQFILGLNELAQKYFRKIYVDHPAGKIAREYAKARGITDEAARTFGIGFAPDSWDAMVSFLRKRGFSDERIQKAGLAKPRRSGRGLIDRFRNRLMIPLHDHIGNIVGFTGRLLEKNAKAPKYLNSPETAVYKKSDVLYGLHLAKQTMRKAGEVVVVEGNLDVVSSHKAGVKNVVASSGTALTESHLRRLKKTVNRIIFAFDADAAGFSAARRGIHLAQDRGFDIGVIRIPEQDGKDPDDIVQKNPERWSELASNPVPIMKYYFDAAMKRYDISRVEGKREFARFFVVEAARLNSPVEQEHWLQKLADVIHVDIDALRKLVSREKNQTGKRRRKVGSGNKNREKRQRKTGRDEHAISFLIGMILHDPSFADAVLPRIDASAVPDGPVSTVYKELVLLYNQEQLSGSAQKPIFSALRNRLKGQDGKDELKFVQAAVLRAEQAVDGQSRDLVRKEIDRHISVLDVHAKKSHRKQLEAAIRQAEASGDQERLSALLEKYTKLL